MVRDGYTAVSVLVVVALILAWIGWIPAATVVVLLGAGVGLFFRDPRRTPLDDPDLVLSPADGRVVEVGEADEEGRALGFGKRIAIFLSVWDVHVNRSPISARIERIEHRPGRFRAAFHPRASEENTRFTWWLQGQHSAILFRQISGVLARRIIIWKQPGDRVSAGEKVGLIRLGSRVEVLFRDPVEWQVSVGDHVRGGLTPLARRTEFASGPDRNS